MQVIKSSEDEKMIALSLTGFRHAIRVAAHYNITTARDLLVHTLYKYDPSHPPNRIYG